MAGPWLYPISAAAKRSFDLKKSGQSVPVTVDSFRALVENGKFVEDRYWYISQNWANVEIGDDLFIYTGDRNLGIIGYATVNDKLRSDGWCILPRFDLDRCQALLNNPVPATIVRKWVFPRRSVTDLGPFQEELRARLPWRATAVTTREAVTDSVLPEEIIEPNRLVEGAVRSITVNTYERDPKARQRCIEAHGTTCCICGFSFGARYGEVAEGYIHVHHLRPLSEVGNEYVVDPVEDLRPVCPNCHGVLHLGGRCRSIEEVRQLVRSPRKLN
jgi:5-methylcytosine-specific restriction endonuclease McrA